MYRGAAAIAKAFRSSGYPLDFEQSCGTMPDTIKFLFVVLCLAGAVYGGAWALAHFPPEQTEVVKPLSIEKLRQR